MKKTMKQCLTLILCLILTAGMTAGCGGDSPSDTGGESSKESNQQVVESSSEDGSEGSSQQEVEDSEPATITALISVGTMPSEENIVLDAIREQSGVNLVVTLTSGADYDNKKATLAASRNLPDLIRYSGRDELKELVANGVVMPLDDLLQTHGQEILANKEGLMDGNKVDGVLYAVPVGGTEAVVPFMVAIRKDWLDKLNLEVPETVDEFYEVMKAFTQNDPNGSGQQDTLGFGMGPGNMRTGIFEAFGIGTSYNCEVDAADVQAALEAVGVDAGIISNLTDAAVDGKLVVPQLLNPHYLDAIKYFRKLYSEGLMEPDFATIPWMQCLDRLWNGNYGSFCFTPVGITNNWVSRYTEDPAPEFVYTILKSEFSDGGVETGQIDNGGICINSACENPEAAMAVLNFLCTEEGNDLSLLGIKDKHYKDNGDGTISYLPPYDENLEQQRIEGGYAYTFLMDRMGSAALKTFNKVTSDAIEMGMEHELDGTVRLVDTPQILTDTGSILTDMATEAFASLVVTNGDLNAEYKSYVEKFCRSGGIDWVSQAVEIYNAN